MTRTSEENARDEMLEDKNAINLNRVELAAVLAGLRLIQLELTRGEFLPQGVHPIFDDDGTFIPLNDEEIDELCERLNQ